MNRTTRPSNEGRVFRIVSPNLRRALHHALDLVLDAIVEEQEALLTKPKQRRVVEPKPIVAPREATPEEKEKVLQNLLRQGFRKAG